MLCLINGVLSIIIFFGLRFINFDKTYKVKKYTYEGNGIIKKGNLVFEKPLNKSKGKTWLIPFVNGFTEKDFSENKSDNNLKYDTFFVVHNKVVILTGKGNNLEIIIEYILSFSRYLLILYFSNSFFSIAKTFKREKLFPVHLSFNL